MKDVCRAIAQIEDPDRIEALLYGSDQHSPGQNIVEESKIEEYFDQYLQRRRNRSPTTRTQYKRTLPEFIEFAVGSGVDYPSELSTDVIESYIDQLFDSYDSDATIVTYTKNLRAWLSWLVKRTGCDEGLLELLSQSELGLTPRARDEAIPADEANTILSQLRKQQFGTPYHALLELLWNTGIRIGGTHALDWSDVNLKAREINIQHRPETGTRLKNGASSDGSSGDGERYITISDDLVEALEAYMKFSRKDVTDEYGREPLFTTSQGRAARSTLRRWIYEATDCRWERENAHELSCDGSCDTDSNVCSYSYYPHAIRRGAIVAHLRAGLEPDRAAERFDVTYKILKKHYDPRTKQEKKQDRADAVRNVWTEI